MKIISCHLAACYKSVKCRKVTLFKHFWLRQSSFSYYEQKLIAICYIIDFLIVTIKNKINKQRRNIFFAIKIFAYYLAYN